MEPADVLRHRSPPGDRERQEQRVQPRVVESLADVLTRADYHALFADRNRGQLRGNSLPFLLAAASAEHDDVADVLDQLSGKPVQVVLAFGQNQRRPARLYDLDYVIENRSIARFVLNEFRVERLELDSCSLHQVELGRTPSAGR